MTAQTRAPAPATQSQAPQTQAPSAAPKTTAGNQAAQPQTQATVDELTLDWATTQIVELAPEELAEYAKTAIPAILKQAAYEHVTDPNQVAYLLATAEHESAFGKPKYERSQSLVEDHNPYSSHQVQDRPRRRGQKPTTHTEWRANEHVHDRTVKAATEGELDEKYWDSAYGGKLGNRRGTEDASKYRGRGYVQLTGRRNYEERSQALNEGGNFYYRDGKMVGGAGGKEPIDLAQHPEDVNENPELAAQLLVTGARDGSFTSQKLDDYIAPGEKPDFVNARGVINGDVRENGASIAAKARRYAVVLGRVWPRVFAPNGRVGGPR